MIKIISSSFLTQNKTQQKMDLEEWDLLSDESFLDLHHQENKFSSKSLPNTTTTVIDMNYFQKFSEPQNKKNKSRVIPVPILLDSHHQQEKVEEIPEKEVTKLPIIETTTKKSDDQKINNKKEAADHQETISQVFFKKLKENEFVDMKMDSPKSLNRGLLPQIDVGTYQFEEKQSKNGNFQEFKDEQQEQLLVIKDDKKSKKINSTTNEEEGLNVWKWAMTGIGALFTFGVAAATVSLIVLGNRHKENCNKSKKQDLHFQLYSHDKRFKQVVRRATNLNEVISVMRGAPVTRAHITIGGYHEAL